VLLLEHDAKTLLARSGVAVPPGVFVGSATELGVAVLPPGPWVVKAQVPVGGRGKAGAIRFADNVTALAVAVDAICAMRVKGHAVRGCRIETQMQGGEAYLSIAVDAAAGMVRMLFSPQGGVDIEDQGSESLRSVMVPLDAAAMHAALPLLTAGAPAHMVQAVASAGALLADLLIRHEALLIEINPLFVLENGHWIAGDARFAVDESALPRQAELTVLISDRPAAYTDALFKFREGFDYIDLDPQGEIGLITTGAGLSMKIIDDFVAQGHKPFNFVDIRSGQFRGDPGRLITVMRAIARGPNIKVVLVNIFAGITHLGEFARLLGEALAAVPELRVPIVARLVGNGLDEARATLAQITPAVELETDLDLALARVTDYVSRHA